MLSDAAQRFRTERDVERPYGGVKHFKFPLIRHHAVTRNTSSQTKLPPCRIRPRRAAHAWTKPDFLELDTDAQWEVLGELDDHTVTGWNKRWEIVNSHFTKEAAEACIRRKQHDYPELRVYVESLYYAREFEAIKAAIFDGTLVYQPKAAADDAAAA